MATITMYWDRIDHDGDPTAGIEITGTGNVPIQIPQEACGFRLGLPNHPWHGAWYFAERGKQGTPLTTGGITYSSAFTGVPSPDAIMAIGPVNNCEKGLYQFQTPLANLGVSGDAPAGAGSFVADFGDERDIEWLDFAGKPTKKTDKGSGHKPAKLPPEFFEQEPGARGCIKDFDGKLHCPKSGDTAAMGPDQHRIAAGSATMLPSAAALASDTTIIPNIKRITTHARKADRPSGIKVEVACPAQLILTATFYKAAGFPPATVDYRFRFAHGPASTVFTTVVDKDGANSVSHSVPIPLPAPTTSRPGGGSGGVTPGGSQGLLNPSLPGGTSPGRGPLRPGKARIGVAAPPENEHKGSVCVEVINAFEGLVTSRWAPYHLVCIEAPSVARHAVPANDYQSIFDRLAKVGSRLLWIDGYTVRNATFFNVIFRPAAGMAWASRHGLTGKDYQAEVDRRRKDGWRPTHVESYVAGGQARYAVVFGKQSGADWAAYHGLSRKQHQERFDALTKQGLRPLNVSVVSPEGVPQYTALYQRSSVGSFRLKSALTPDQYQAESDANREAGRGLAYLNAYQDAGGPRFSAIWTAAASKGSLVARHGLTSDSYQQEFNRQSGAGRSLQLVTGYEHNGEHRFAALWKK